MRPAMRSAAPRQSDSGVTRLLGQTLFTGLQYGDGLQCLRVNIQLGGCQHCLRGVQEDEHIYVLLLACFASALFTGMFCGTILANVREQAERC